MEVHICDRKFDSNDIKNISFNHSNTKIFIDTDDDFIILSFNDESDIIEAKQWIRLQQLSLKELNEAISIIINVCNYFINTETQCSLCPIKRTRGCLFENIPINWK